MSRAIRHPAGPAGAEHRPARGVAALATAFHLVLTRARRDLLGLIGVLLLVTVTGALAVAVPAEVDATLDAAAREAVARAGSDADLLVRSSVDDVSGYATTTAERLLAFAQEMPQQLPPDLAGVLQRIDTGIIGPELAAQGPAGDVSVRMGVLDGAATSELRLIAGSFPQAGPATSTNAATPTLDAAISSATASAAGLSVGDTLAVSGAGESAVPDIRIAAIVDAVDPSSRRWTDLPGIWDPETSTSRGGSPVVSFTALTDPSTFDRVALQFPEPSAGSIRTSFDPALFDVSRLEAVRASIDELETAASAIGQGAPFTVVAFSHYEEALQDFPAEATAATAQLSTIAAGLFGVAVLVCVLAYTALSRRRRTEVALLRSRGASLGLIGVHAAVESVIVTMAGVVLGVGIATVSGGTVRSQVLLVAVAVVVASAPVMSTLRPLLPPPSRAHATALRFTGVGALIALAVTALLALGSGVNVGGAQLDPLALVAPILCATVVALCLSPLPAALTRPLSRLTSQTRGTGALLAGSSAQDGRSVLALVAVILAASGAITSLVLLQSVASGQESAAWRVVGADVRIDGAADASALTATLQTRGVEAAAIAQLERVDVQGETSTALATLLAVDSDYPALISALPADVAPPASVDAISRLTASDAASREHSPDDPVPVVIDARGAAAMRTDGFTLEVAGVAVPVSVVGAPIEGPGYVDGPVVMVDRARLSSYLASRGGEAAAADDALLAPTTVLAVGPDAAGIIASHLAAAGDSSAHVLSRGSVLGEQRNAALISGVTAATIQSLIATAILAALAVIVTTVLGARRRGRTLALLEALGVPRRAGMSLAAGELAPLVVGGIAGGAVTAAVVVLAAGSAFDLDSLVGGTAAIDFPGWLPLAVLGAGAAILALAIAIDTPLSRRVTTTDILRSGEES